MKTLELQVEIFLLIALGYVLTKKGKVSERTRSQATDLVLSVFLPAAVIQSFQMNLTPQIVISCVEVFLFSIVSQLVYWLFMRLSWNKIEDHDKRICLQYATMVSNAGFMGMPIAEAAFGAQGLLYASIFLIPQRILMWSVGLSLFAGGTSRRQTIRRVLTHPCIIAVEIGLVVMILELCGIYLPDWLSNTIGAVADCNTALCMMIIGSILTDVPFRELKDPTSWIFALVRLAVIPLTIFILFRFAGLSGLAVDICVLQSAMPAPNTLVMLSSKYERAPRFAARLVFSSTLLSLVALPIWMIILSA